MGILNSLNESLEDAHIFVAPFAFRNIAILYQNMRSFNMDCVQTHEFHGATLKLDTSMRRLYVSDNIYVHLINKEFFVMKFLFEHKGKIVSKVDLLEFVWGKNLLSSPGTIDVHMCRLRKKLMDHLNFDPIRTVHGAGYIFG